jgi:predicted nucleotidyltransferase
LERRRKNVGRSRRVVDHLAAHTDLRGSLLAGSAAKGTCDKHSDIDLLNYFKELPAPALFTELMRGLGAEPMGEIGDPALEGFGGSFRIAGVEVQTGAKRSRRPRGDWS